MPIGTRTAGITEGMKDLAARARAAGKKPEDFPVTVYGAPADLDTLKRYTDAGVERANFWLPPQDRDRVLTVLDGFAALARKGP
jgi:hypothetical protein